MKHLLRWIYDHPITCWLIACAVFALIAVGLSLTTCPMGFVWLVRGCCLICAMFAAEERENDCTR